MVHRVLEGDKVGEASGRGGDRTGGVFSDDGGCVTHRFEGGDLCGVSGSLFLEGLGPFYGRIVDCAVGGEWGAQRCRQCLMQHGAAAVRCVCDFAVNLALLFVVLCDKVFLVETQSLSVPYSQLSNNLDSKMS